MTLPCDDSLDWLDPDPDMDMNFSHVLLYRGYNLSVTVNGKPGRLAILGDDGSVIAAGDQVAREAEAVAINSYRQLLIGKGHLRVLSKPIDAGGGRRG